MFKNTWISACLVCVISHLIVFDVNASSFDLRTGFQSFKLGSNQMRTYVVGEKHGGLHASEAFCALTGLHVTSNHESDYNLHHKGGHVRPVSYSVTLNSDKKWIVRYAGGRPSDSITVACFRLKGK